MSGDDATALEFMQAGGQGVISVTLYVLPVLWRSFVMQHQLAKSRLHKN